MERSIQENDLEFIYPVAFEDFCNFRRQQQVALTSGFSVQELGKLRKVKKLLEITEEKINNRIKLFKKVSMDIKKKKEKQNMFRDCVDTEKKDIFLNINERIAFPAQSSLKSTVSSLNYLRNRKESIGNKQDKESLHKTRQIVFEEKIDHAKQIKLERQRNKVIVQERKAKELRKNLQSANIIRSHRTRAKDVKIMLEKERFEQARKIKEQRWKDQIGKYEQLQGNLTRLQREERQALIMWKRAMEKSD